MARNLLEIAPSLNVAETRWVLWLNNPELYNHLGLKRIETHHILLFDRAKTIKHLHCYLQENCTHQSLVTPFLTELINKLEKGLEPKKQA